MEEGALADLVLVDGNPLEDIAIIEDPARRFMPVSSMALTMAMNS